MNSITKFIKKQNVVFDETLDVDEILKNVVETEYDPKLVSRTLNTIQNMTLETKTSIQNKLKLYRLVDDVFALHKGKHVRWMNKEDKTNKLYTGGIAVDIKFYDNGTQILIFNKYLKRNFQIHFDKVFLFQKLSFEEEIVLHLKRTI